MGEYANLQIREDIKRMTGIDPGPVEDDESRFLKPIYKRVQCSYCPARPKERGLKNHLWDKHGIGAKP